MIKKAIKKIIDRLLICWYVIFKGASYQNASRFAANRKNGIYGKKAVRRLMTVLPFNAEFDRMLDDLLTAEMVLSGYPGVFPKIFALKLDGKEQFCHPMDPEAAALGVEDIIGVIETEKRVLVRSNRVDIAARMHTLGFDGDYIIDGCKAVKEQLTGFLLGLPKDSLICENVLTEQSEGCKTLHISVLSDEKKHKYIVDSAVFDHEKNGKFYLCGQSAEKAGNICAETERAVLELASALPEIDYIGFDIVEAVNGIRVLSADTGIELAFYDSLAPELEAYIEQTEKKRKMGMLKRAKKYVFALKAKNKGFIDFMYGKWLEGLKEDRSYKGTTREQKKWANERGFYSWRIEQYRLSDENFTQLLSDYDYKRLRPLNDYFAKWINNKRIFDYILRPYGEYLPRCYYRMYCEDGRPMLHSAADSGLRGIEELISLLRERKILCVKKARGSHGDGFKVLKYADGQLYINNRPVSESEFGSQLCPDADDVLVCEYVDEHKSLKNIYPNAVSTVRVMTIRDGGTVGIKHAYLRIGTKRTGNTDNIAGGGISAEVELETGKIANPVILENHVFSTCEKHPDTGVAISGYIPHWEEIKLRIEEICRYLFPLEYMGFDVAVTENGFKILEINSHQDLHRYADYPEEVKEFFRRKLEDNKEKCRV